MNILLIGSGGREHTMAWKLAQSPKLSQLYIAPGNAGTSQHGVNVAINPENFPLLKTFCLEKKIDMVVVGPEAPLVAGIADFISEDEELAHIPVIGPKKAGALLEGSKDFSKAFMLRNNVPTGAAKTFDKSTLSEGMAYLETQQPPYVLKADGLAAGKGVIITEDLAEAKATLEEMLGGKFGTASSQVLVEQYLKGIELSVFVLTDGKEYVILPEAKDYKRIGEGDTGLNTGGMGAISPVPFADAAFLKKVEEKVVKPSIAGLQKENIPFVGFLFIGLMNVEGEPYVIEYNVRMGDPETEVVFPRIKSDLVELFELTAQGKLSEAKPEIDSRFATTVMLVSGGYPEGYEKGKKMEGIPEVTEAIPFHAGTKLGENGEILTSGGRVMALTAFGETIEEALKNSYAAANKICFDKIYYRKDIGFDLK